MKSTITIPEPQLLRTNGLSSNLSRFGPDAALVVGAGVIANVFSYVFHFLISRQLGPERYGTLVTFIAIMMMVGVVGTSVGTVMMQRTARMWASNLREDINYFTRRTGRFVLLTAALLGCGLFVSSFVLGKYLHITTASWWLLVALYVTVAALTASARGAAQGAHRFGIFAASLIGEYVARVVICCGLVALAFGLAGALGGLLASAFIALAITCIPLATSALDAGRNGEEDIRLVGETLRVFGVTAAMNALLFIDMLFAKHYFSGATAGYFGAANTLSRTLPFGAALLALIVMPKAAAALHTSSRALAHVLVIAAGMTLAAVLCGLVTFIAFGKPIVTLTFGAAFAPASSFIRLYAIDEGLIALWMMAVSYLIAVSRYEIFRILVGALVCEVLGFALLGFTPFRLLWVAIAINSVLVPVAWGFALQTLRKGRSVTDPRCADTLPAPRLEKGVYILLPVLNECANVSRLLDGIENQLGCMPFTVGILDDGSEDGTVEVIRARLRRPNHHLQLICRKKTSRGSQRGSALRELMLWGLENTSHEIFVEMDGDLSHRPEELPDGIALIASGQSDVAIASKYVAGSAVVNRPWGRRAVSRICSYAVRALIDPKVRDYSNGFRFYTRGAAQVAAEHAYHYGSPIYLSEVLALWMHEGVRVVEFKSTYIGRNEGLSKLRVVDLLKASIAVFEIASRYHVRGFRRRAIRSASYLPEHSRASVRRV